MKTFSIRLKADTTIEGVKYPAEFQIGAVTSEVGPLTLLGLIQFKHAILEEVADSPDDEGDAFADGDDGEPEAGESAASPDESQCSPPDEETVAEPPVAAQQGAGSADSTVMPADNESAVGSFMRIGLDKPTADALVYANKITSVQELAAYLDDPSFTLLDLEDIGTVRAEKIKAAFQPST